MSKKTGKDKLKALQEKAKAKEKEDTPQEEHEEELLLIGDAPEITKAKTKMAIELHDQVIEKVEEEANADKTDDTDTSVVPPTPDETEEAKPKGNGSNAKKPKKLSFAELMKELGTILETHEIMISYHLKVKKDPLKDTKYIIYHRSQSNRAATIYENGLVRFYRTSVKKVLSRVIEKGTQLREFMGDNLYDEC